MATCRCLPLSPCYTGKVNLAVLQFVASFWCKILSYWLTSQWWVGMEWPLHNLIGTVKIVDAFKVAASMVPLIFALAPLEIFKSNFASKLNFSILKNCHLLFFNLLVWFCPNCCVVSTVYSVFPFLRKKNQQEVGFEPKTPEIYILTTRPLSMGGEASMNPCLGSMNPCLGSRVKPDNPQVSM